MLSREAARKRLDEIKEEFLTKTADVTSGRLTDKKNYNKWVDRANEEVDELKATLKQHDQIAKYAGATEVSNGGLPMLPVQTKSATGDTGHSEPKWAPGSPLDAPAECWQGMYEAMQRKQGFRFEIPAVETKGIAGEVGLKAAVSDTGLGGPPYSPTPTGLPAVIQPGLSMPIRLEPDRFWSHLPGIAVDAPAIEYIAHTSDGANPSVVAELSAASDVGMNFVPKVLTSTKIAAMGSASVEALQDYRYFAQWIPSELSRLMINEETNYVVNGGTESGPTGFGGILSFSGTLTRAVGPDTPLDAIQKSFNDLRVGSAYATADLVAMHPTTWNAIRRQKSSFNSYLLNPNPETGIVDTIWGVTVVVNTWFPIGTAIVLDTNQSLLAWTRSSLVVEGNPYGDGWDSFYWQYRAFERIGLGMRWPTAICIVTGLPTT